MSTKPSRSRSKGRLAAVGIVVAFGERPHRAEGAQADGRQRGFAAAGDGDIGLAALDHLENVAHRVGRAGAGRDHDLVRAVQAVVDGKLRAGGVADELRNGEGRDLVGAFIQEPGVLDFDRFQAADARAENHGAAAAVFLGEIQAGVACTASTPLTKAYCTKRSNFLTSFGSM